MKKKGFTLIELLAVIVILSIIAVITVPMIMNVIDKAKIGALEDSAYGLVESANLWYAENVSNSVKDTKFTIEKNKQTSDNTDITKLLSYKGTIDKGYVSILSTGKVAICIDNNTKKIEKGYSDSKVTTSNGKCDGTFVNNVGSTDDEELTTSTIKELQNRISIVEGKVDEINNILTPVTLFSGTADTINTEYALNDSVAKYKRFSIKVVTVNNTFSRSEIYSSDLDNLNSQDVGTSGSNYAENTIQYKITSTSKLVLSYKGYSAIKITEVIGYKY